MTSNNRAYLPLDPSFYNPREDEVAFFKAQTGIQDESELKNHILQVQADAYAIYPYSCIRRFVFTSLKISKYPAYESILKLGKERPDAILLDLGCCFGNDARTVIADGYPCESVITSDLRSEFWALGHKLFKTSPETFPVTFVAGDIFDPTFLSPTASPVRSSSITPDPAPPLSALTSLTPLQHHVQVIHASSFFHLFSESQQHTLAHLLGTLLSPLPGSMILGSHIALPDREEGDASSTPRTAVGFSHNPTSWEKLWAGEDGVFRPEDVTLWTKIQEVERKDVIQAGGDPGRKAYLLVWTITRV